MENEGFSKQNTSSNGTVYFRCRLRARFGCNALMKISPNNMPGQHNWRMYRLSRHHHIPANERFQRGLPEHVKGVLYPSPILLSPNYPQPCTTSPVYPPPTHTHHIPHSRIPHNRIPYSHIPHSHIPHSHIPHSHVPRIYRSPMGSSESIRDHLKVSMDLNLNSMVTLLLRLPAATPCPPLTVHVRLQIANLMQATKQQMGHVYMAETVEGVKSLWDIYHFSSDIRSTVSGQDMIFLTPRDDISMGEGENRTFHLVLSCQDLLENARLRVPYSSVVGWLDGLPLFGPAQLHLDETYKVLLNNFPLFSLGHADVQLR